MIKFNLNDYIKVKLTDLGREKHKKSYSSGRFAPVEIPEDENGYTKIQLWEFCNIFRQFLYNGAELVCETEILLDCQPEKL